MSVGVGLDVVPWECRSFEESLEVRVFPGWEEGRVLVEDLRRRKIFAFCHSDRGR